MPINNPSTNTIDNGINDPLTNSVDGGIFVYGGSPPPSAADVTWGDGTDVTWGDGTQVDWSASS